MHDAFDAQTNASKGSIVRWGLSEGGNRSFSPSVGFGSFHAAAFQSGVRFQSVPNPPRSLRSKAFQHRMMRSALASAAAPTSPMDVDKGHSVAPSLRENPIALIHGVNALRHRALAASGCPGPKVCWLYPAIEGCSTRST